MAQETASKVSRVSPTSLSVAGQKRKRTTEKKYYGVKAGKSPGIYETWDECLAQVRGHKGAVFKAFTVLREAQAFVEGKLVPFQPQSSDEQRFYAVLNGKTPGVYTDWATAQTQIAGVRNPRHKRFNTREEAEQYLVEGRGKQADSDVADATRNHKTRKITQLSAPGLVAQGSYAPRDKQGNAYELGKGPLPTGAEDGFDPNILLDSDGTIKVRTGDQRTKTKLIPKEHESASMLRIYTDGSSLKNGQAGARAGVGVFFGPQDPKNVSEALKGSKQTNQRAELTAILRALEIAPRHRDVTIYTDSRYSIDCVTTWYRGWVKNSWVNSKGKPVENKDLVQEVREKMDERELLGQSTFFVWVKGHANDAGNIAADRLANQGALLGRGADVEANQKSRRSSKQSSEGDIGLTRLSGTDMTAEEDETEQSIKLMRQAMEE